MPIFEPGPLLGSQSTQYQISRSLRFRSSASAYLSRTPASAGNRKTWTWSAWIKRGTLGTSQYLLTIGSSYTDTGFMGISFAVDSATNSDCLNLTTGTQVIRRSTNQLRDPSAWYHCLIAFDTTQSTASNRAKMYVNGTQVTVFQISNDPALNTDYGINQALTTYLGRNSVTADTYFDGYLAEVNFIDGQALTPSSFGAFDTNGVWQPIACTVSDYGKNGFYLPFSDSANIFNDKAAIATNHSAANNWTASGLQTSSSTLTTYDYLLDSPTNYADGGNGRGNYATLNPLFTNGSPSISSANLNVTGGSTQSSVSGTIGASSGKYYAEFIATSIGSNTHFGVFALGNNTNGANVGPGQDSRCIYRNDGGVFTSSQVGTYASYTTSNTIGVALNLDASPPTVTFYKDNTSQGTVNLSTSFSNWTFAMLFNASSDAAIINFGQRPFTYTPPSGFSALNTQNLPTPTIAAGNKYFDATTYSGTGSAQSITNSGSFQPDFVWLKCRSAAYSHDLEDVVRGAGNYLASDSTAAATAFGNVTSFNANGFSIATGSTANAASNTYVAWQWKGGNGTSNIAVNAYGSTPSIASTVSANTSAGFSVVTYTGTGANATVGHGLGVAPSMIIVKNRTDGTRDWIVYHTSIGNTGGLQLDTTAGTTTAPTYWNNTSPTSSVFTVGSANALNGSTNNIVAYCFAPVAGYSAFGSYTGNGSATDGPFVYTGFRPRYVLFKDITTASREWIIQDTSRQTYNNAPNNAYNLSADSSAAENDATVLGGPANANNIDFLSNGFKLKYNNANCNASGDTYIYAAFAENPLKFARAR